MFLPALAFVVAQSAAPSWASLQAAYNYSPPAAPTFVKVVGDEPSFKFTFTGSPGDTVHAILVEPKGTGKFPVVILLHGLGGNKEYMAKTLGDDLIQHGIAYAAIDAPGHGERQTEADKTAFGKIMGAFVVSKGDLFQAILKTDSDGSVLGLLNRATVKGIVDNRILLDFISLRPEIDGGRVGVIGDSMGSIMGSIWGAVDSRVKAMALMVGGDPVVPFLADIPANMRDAALDGSCSLYAPHCSAAVFMLNGTKDTIMPRSATDRLYNAFPQANRSIKWYESDHFLPPAANGDSVDWIAGKLK